MESCLRFRTSFTSLAAAQNTRVPLRSPYTFFSLLAVTTCWLLELVVKIRGHIGQAEACFYALDQCYKVITGAPLCQLSSFLIYIYILCIVLTTSISNFPILSYSLEHPLHASITLLISDAVS